MILSSDEICVLLVVEFPDCLPKKNSSPPGLFRSRVDFLSLNFCTSATVVFIDLLYKHLHPKLEWKTQKAFSVPALIEL